jgi:hypothetical protein
LLTERDLIEILKEINVKKVSAHVRCDQALRNAAGAFESPASALLMISTGK